jgi:hypothetical protein
MEFANCTSIPDKPKMGFMQFLVTSGLTMPFGGQTFNDAGVIYYQPTELGLVFRKAFAHGERLIAPGRRAKAT